MHVVNRGVRFSVHFQFVLLLYSLCAVLISACGGAPPDAGTDAATLSTPVDAGTAQTILPTATVALDTAALPLDGSGQPIVARVNDAVVTLEEYQRTLARYRQQEYLFADDEALRAAVMGTLVEQRLIDQAAVQQNISISDDDLNRELSAYIEQAGGETGWSTWLVQNGYTDAEFRETLRDSLTVNRMRDQVTLVVLGELPQVRARHILVQDEALAALILAQVQAGGDFAALAAQHSIDQTSKDNGGDLGWFTREELTDETLAAVVFDLEPGALAGPVRSSLGYHIVQSLERGSRPVDEAKRPQLAQVFFDRWLNSLIESSAIEYYLEN
ncbi:MAG: peptidylprolyl isomerase [bacterium]|nr:peptidylprolyl isomerase [bacterium]